MRFTSGGTRSVKKHGLIRMPEVKYIEILAADVSLEFDQNFLFNFNAFE